MLQIAAAWHDSLKGCRKKGFPGRAAGLWASIGELHPLE